MPPSGSPGTRARLQPAAGPAALSLRSSLRRGRHPALPGRSRGRAAVRAIAAWLRRVLAESARAWALAAGVPPHLYELSGAAVAARDNSGRNGGAALADLRDRAGPASRQTTPAGKPPASARRNR